MRLARPTLLLVLASLLAACGGGNGGDSLNAGVTVTPALGKVSYAEVSLRRLDGSLLATGNLGSEGSVRLPRPADGGLVVTVSGGDNVFYFDEGVGSARPLVAGRALHAVSAGPRDRIAVTALTEFVYQRARALAAGGALTPALIRSAEAEVAATFGAPESGSFLDDPDMIDDALDAPDTGTTAGRAARWLAGLADFALYRGRGSWSYCDTRPDCAPLPDLIADLAADFRDGSLDGIANGAPLASAFYTTDSADELLAGVETAADRFMARVAATAGQDLTDKRIGQLYAGDYGLSCHDTTVATPRNVAMRLLIGSDGGFRLTTPQGVITLPAGSSTAWLQAADTNAGYARATVVLPASHEETDALPVSAGLVITLHPSLGLDMYLWPAELRFDSSILAPADAHHVMIGADAASGGFLLWQGKVWACDGMPSPEAAIAGATNSVTNDVNSWLPDGTYDCETADPGALASASVSDGSLSIDGHAWPYLSAARAEEVQHGPLDLPETVTHTHVYDAITLARWPVQELTLKAALDGSGNVLQLRRSLSTGKAYFNATLDGVSYQHCVADAPQVNLVSGFYTRTPLVILGSGSSGTLTASFGGSGDGGGIYVGLPTGSGAGL